MAQGSLNLTTFCLIILFSNSRCSLLNQYQTYKEVNIPVLNSMKNTFVEDQETSTSDSPILYNLDRKDDVKPFWSTSSEFKHYLEYYNTTTDFKKQSANNSTCSFYMTKEKIDTLSDTEGIWVACQDQTQPSECANAGETSPCIPSIKFDNGLYHNANTTRTIMASFAVETFGILRLSVESNCIDYSKRRDPFSTCQFTQTKKDEETLGWNYLLFSFYPDISQTFNTFTIELLARFELDVVLIDTIEASNDLLCPNAVECTTASTQSTTASQSTTTTTTLSPSTTPTTPEPIVTDPYDDDDTPDESSSTLTAINLLTLFSFSVIPLIISFDQIL